MEVSLTSLEDWLLSSERGVVVLSMFGCAPCVNVKAAAENLSSDYPAISWMVAYFDRRQSRDRDFLDHHSVVSLPAVWIVERGYIKDVTGKIERDSAPAARSSLTRALEEWLSI